MDHIESRDFSAADLEVAVTVSERAVRLAVRGEVDMDTAARLSEALASAARKRPDRIDVDLADVTFLDSSGIKALLDGRRAADRVAAPLVLRNPQPIVRRVLEMSGLEEAFGLPTSGTSRRLPSRR